MTTDAIGIIDKKINVLISDSNEYGFNELKQKVETILKSVDIFLIDGELDSKAIDLYLKNVITQRNEIKRQQESLKTKAFTIEDKYKLIESICQKLEFESQEALLQKLEELEVKTSHELQIIYNNL